MRSEDPVELAAQFRSFGRSAGRDGAPLYARLCEHIAGDRWLLELAATSPPEQRRPNLLLAGVHFLLLGGTDHPLTRHYPTVRALAGGRAAAPPPESDPCADFADFCRAHHDRLVRLLATRATQTNEIGRSAALLPGLGAVAAATGGTRPLALLELGASAGLNLLFDRYAYDYGDGRRTGVAGSPVLLRCEVRHGHPDLQMPDVSWRAGLDLHPVDPADEPSARWLLACLWPDHLARFERLRAALALAAAAPDRPVVEQGDMVADLPALAGRAPADSTLCLFHSWVAAYLTPDRQRALAAAVAELAARRPLAWLFAELPYEVPGLVVPAAPPDGRRGATALVLTTYEEGRADARRLADLHPHGRWLRWWAG